MSTGPWATLSLPPQRWPHCPQPPSNGQTSQVTCPGLKAFSSPPGPVPVITTTPQWVIWSGSSRDPLIRPCSSVGAPSGGSPSCTIPPMHWHPLQTPGLAVTEMRPVDDSVLGEHRGSPAEGPGHLHNPASSCSLGYRQDPRVPLPASPLLCQVGDSYHAPLRSPAPFRQHSYKHTWSHLSGSPVESWREPSLPLPVLSDEEPREGHGRQ